MKNKKELARILDKLASVAFELATLVKTATESQKARMILHYKQNKLNLLWQEYQDYLNKIKQEDNDAKTLF